MPAAPSPARTGRPGRPRVPDPVWAVVGVALVLGVFGVLALVPYRGCSCPAQYPLGAAVAFDGVRAPSTAQGNWTNFTAVHVGPQYGLTLGATVFGFHARGGAELVPAGGWRVVALAPDGSEVGTFDPHRVAWTAGGGVSISNGTQLDVFTNATSLAGGMVDVFGLSPFGGEILVPVPAGPPPGPQPIG